MRLYTNEEMINILEQKWNNDPIFNALKNCWSSISNKEVDVENIFHRYLDSKTFDDNQIDTENNYEVNKKEQIDWHLHDLKIKLCYDIECFSGVVDLMDSQPFDVL